MWGLITGAAGFVTGGSAVRLVSTLLAGVALGGWGGWQLASAARHRMAADHLREAARAIEAARTETNRLQEQADEATRRATERTHVAQRAAAGARAELDRLRQQLAAGAPADAAACPATAERAATIATVQRECAGALEDLGRRADAHAADALKLWEAWPRPPD